MHDLKPLILPKLVAARKSSKSSFDMSAEPTSSVYSCADSGFYSASECSTPPTPIFSRGHYRFPSSASSLSSSPPTHEIIEAPNASGKLPKLTEEPLEQEYHYGPEDPHRCSCDTDLGHESNCEIARAYEFQDEYFRSVDAEIRMAKRRRSLESSANSITNKIERRFPSLSRKVKERKRASSSFTRVSRSETPSRVPSTRSSSITSSIRHVQSFDVSQQYSQVPTPAHSMEQLGESPASPMEIDVAKANAIDIDIDPAQVEAERYATTPLLPPLLMCRDDLPTSSPLQSPTIADASQSCVPTPMGTPPVRAYPTPTLSAKPSMASIKTSRPGYAVSSAEIPPMMLADPNDKWTNLLGHANFTILPEPYVPEHSDAASLRQLFADWESARCNYAKHQVRTAEHYGVTSKHYTLTEQKWAEIDAEWKRNHELTASAVAAKGHISPEPLSPVEPAPLSKMPSLNDPKSEGKFPKLGDEDVVGPMVQIASPLMLKTPSRKRAFFKFLSDLLPGSLLGRSSAGVRGH